LCKFFYAIFDLLEELCDGQGKFSVDAEVEQLVANLLRAFDEWDVELATRLVVGRRALDFGRELAAKKEAAGSFLDMSADLKRGVASMWAHVIIKDCNVEDLAPLLLEHQQEELGVALGALVAHQLMPAAALIVNGADNYQRGRKRKRDVDRRM